MPPRHPARGHHVILERGTAGNPASSQRVGRRRAGAWDLHRALLPRGRVCSPPARWEDVLMTAFNSGGAQIVDPSIFRVLVEMETRKAQRMRYVVSLVCVGIEHAESAGQALAQRVAPGIRATDAVATQGDDSVTMLLVDAEDSNLPTIMERLRPGLDDVSWSAGGASYPKTAATRSED